MNLTSGHSFMKLIISFFIVFGLITFSCNYNQKKRPENSKAIGDTVIKDIPEWYRTSKYGPKNDEKLRKLLNLPSLQNGFDSLQIRIFIDCGYETSNLIILENKKSQWNAAFYSFKIHYDEKGSPSEIQNLHIENRSPESGWKNFSDTFFRIGIIDLPDVEKFGTKYNFPTDANVIWVEIGTPKKYRLYSYPELGLNTDIKEGPGKLQEAVRLIEKEFNYKRPCQDSTNGS